MEWRNRVVIFDEALVVSRSARSMAECQENFNESVVCMVEFLKGMPRVPLVFNFDFWSFRTPEEAAVGQKLAGLRSRVTEWLGSAKLHQDEIFWRHSRLPNDYKLLKKARDSLWSDTVCVERRTRERTGVLLQWHQSETENGGADFATGANLSMLL